MPEPTKFERLVAEFNAWEQMVKTGLDAAGERVIVDGRMVPDLRRQMLAGIGQAYVEAASRPRAPEGARVTRYTFTVWDRGEWGHEEVHVEEVCGLFDWPEGKHWRITQGNQGTSLWHPRFRQFIFPSTKAQWKAVKYASAEEALAEAPRAVAHCLKRVERRLAEYDAEQAKKTG